MAYGIDSHKFCCCLPVRLGVFVISFIQLVSSGVIAGGSYYVIAQERFDKQQYKTVSIVTAVIMTVLFIVSLLGFIGSLLRRLPLVRLYSRTLNWLLAINVVGGVASIILLVTSNQAIIDACTGGSTDESIVNTCSHAKTYKWVMIGLIVFNWAVHFYECVIVARYAIQLQEEKEERWRLSAMKTYSQIPRRDSTDAFISPPTTYPYADKENSYGSHNIAYKA